MGVRFPFEVVEKNADLIERKIPISLMLHDAPNSQMNLLDLALRLPHARACCSVRILIESCGTTAASCCAA